MSNLMSVLAQANEADGEGSAFLVFLILFGFLYAIYKALTKKKSYRFGGTVTER